VHLLIGAIGLGISAIVCVGVAADNEYRHTLAFLVQLALTFSVVWFAPGVIGGWGLLTGKRWGRWIIWALSALMLPLIPVGPVLGGAGVWVLLSTREKLDQGFERTITAVEKAAPRYYGFALAALAAIVTLAGMIGLGYLFRNQIENAHIDNGLIGPVAFVIIIVVMLGFALASGRGWSVRQLTPEAIRLRHEGRKRTEAIVAAHEQRLAQLSADPVRARYVALMRAGEYWSDEQIAYDLNPDQPATCVHLATVEQAMRRLGLKVRWLAEKHVTADCRVDEVALWEAFKPAPEVSYNADLFPGGGRGSEEFPNCALQCAACNSGIHTLHERESKAMTPWFPRAPA
jgi:hypothetical protein